MNSSTDTDYSDEWWVNRNARRRERYQSDDEYRQMRQEESRRWWRETHATGTNKCCMENINALDVIGKKRMVHFHDGPEQKLCFTVSELAVALGGYATQVMYRWFDNEQIPRPVVEADDYNNSFGRSRFPVRVGVFLEAEVKAIMTALGPHQETYRQFRREHTEVIADIRNRVNQARAKNDIQ